MVKIVCNGRIELAILHRKRNSFRDAQTVKSLRKLFRYLNHYNDAWLLIAFDLWNMSANDSHIAFLECVDMELNDNEATLYD